MDNAIEASETGDNKFIEIDINCVDNIFSIKISNSCNDFPDINMINNRGWSTKANNRGIGLYDVQKTLHKYKNIQNNTCINNNLFVQEIIVS